MNRDPMSWGELLLYTLILAPFFVSWWIKFDARWRTAGPEGDRQHRKNWYIEHIQNARAASAADHHFREIQFEFPDLWELRNDRIDRIYAAAIEKAEFVGRVDKVPELAKEWQWYRRGDAAAVDRITAVETAAINKVYGPSRGSIDSVDF